MATLDLLDLVSKDGELDRDKVIKELDRIISAAQVKTGSIVIECGAEMREQIINLISRAVDQAQVDAERWCESW